MDQLLPGTDVTLFTWYPADQLPPDLLDEALIEKSDDYEVLLAIRDIGVLNGGYSSRRESYWIHCQRYDSFDDEPVEGWTREQEINNNLEWETEEVDDDQVTHWMIITSPPIPGKEFPTTNTKFEYLPGTNVRLSVWYPLNEQRPPNLKQLNLLFIYSVSAMVGGRTTTEVHYDFDEEFFYVREKLKDPDIWIRYFEKRKPGYIDKDNRIKVENVSHWAVWKGLPKDDEPESES